MKRLARMVCVFLLASLAACDSRPSSVRTTLTGLVDATEIDVAAKVPGRVAALFVKEGDRVKAGARLVTLEVEELTAKVHQASAAIGAARAKLMLAQSGARVEEKQAARKALEAAQHQVDIAKKMYDRMASLFKANAIPKAAFDDAEFKLNLAKSQLAMAEARHEMVQSGARPEEVEALRALVRKGSGALEEVRSLSKEKVQYAPISGEVTKIVVHKGELAAPGYPILTLVDLDDLWVSFAVREDRLRRIRKKDLIEVEIPALGRKVPMKVFQIAALGDFATWRATSEKGGFDLKSFEVKARPTSPVEGLRPGMTARWILED
jgi:HlyD family secretion protein